MASASRCSIRATRPASATPLVYSIVERRNGDIWFATYGGGVSRFADGRFTQFTTRDGLSNDYATCLREDRIGALWIGTVGGGVESVSRRPFHRVYDGEWPAEQSRPRTRRR